MKENKQLEEKELEKEIFNKVFDEHIKEDKQKLGTCPKCIERAIQLTQQKVAKEIFDNIEKPEIWYESNFDKFHKRILRLKKKWVKQ
jgi:hypothetical protein